MDRNSDGQITSRSELISNTTLPGVTTGMQALGTFDTNGDGVVDDAEANAAGLRVWEPGASGQGGPLLTRADAGIASLSLQTIGDGSYDVAGNKVVSHFTFTFLNGTLGQGAEIEFGVGSAAGSSPPSIPVNPPAIATVPSSAPTAASQLPTTWTPSAQVSATPSASDLASAAALAAANQARLAALTSPAPL